MEMAEGKRKRYYTNPEEVKFKILAPEKFFSLLTPGEYVDCISCLRSDYLFDNVPGHEASYRKAQDSAGCPSRNYHCRSSNGQIKYYFERPVTTFYITTDKGHTFVKTCACALSRDTDEVDGDETEV